MRSFIPRHLLSIGLLAGWMAGAGLVSAQTAGGPLVADSGATHQRWHDPALRQQRISQRLAQLKGQLDIAPAQEDLWSRFAAAMQPRSASASDRTPLERAEWARMTTPQRIDHLQAMRAEHQGRADRRANATKDLYAALTPAQQQMFDQLPRWTGMGPGRHHGRHHRGAAGVHPQ